MPVLLEIADPKTADAAMRSIALAMAADLVDAGVDLDDDAKVALALIERRWTSPVVARLMDAAVAAVRATGHYTPPHHKQAPAPKPDGWIVEVIGLDEDSADDPSDAEIRLGEKVRAGQPL